MASMFTMHSLAGFNNAPVTKGLISIIVAGTGIVHLPPSAIKNLNIHMYISPNHIQLVRIVMQRLFFWNLKDLMCGCLLLYYFRIFERRYGSHKYVNTLFANLIMSQAIHYSLVYLANNMLHYDIGSVPPGPYGMIWSQFVPYFTEIPAVAYTDIFNIFPVTGKTLTYLIGLQMIAPSSSIMLAALSGIVSCVIYRRNVLFVQRWLRIPTFVSRFCKWLFLRSSNSGSANGVVEFSVMPATLDQQRQLEVEQMEQQMALLYQQQQQGHPAVRHRHRGAVAPANRSLWNTLFNRNPIPNTQRMQYEHINGGENVAQNQQSTRQEPTEENIARVLEMGFPSRSAACAALAQSGNDLAMATNILLQETPAPSSAPAAGTDTTGSAAAATTAATAHQQHDQHTSSTPDPGPDPTHNTSSLATPH